MSEPLQERLREVGKLLDGKAAKCPGFELEPGVYTGCSCPGPPADCPVCEGSGEVSDPAYGELRKIARDEHPYHEPQIWGYGDVTCMRCNIALPATKPCYSIRSWGKDKGALAGAIAEASRGIEDFRVWDVMSWFQKFDPDLAAVETLLVWLRKEVGSEGV